MRFQHIFPIFFDISKWSHVLWLKKHIRNGSVPPLAFRPVAGPLRSRSRVRTWWSCRLPFLGVEVELETLGDGAKRKSLVFQSQKTDHFVWANLKTWKKKVQTNINKPNTSQVCKNTPKKCWSVLTAETSGVRGFAAISLASTMEAWAVCRWTAHGGGTVCSSMDFFNFLQSFFFSTLSSFACIWTDFLWNLESFGTFQLETVSNWRSCTKVSLPVSSRLPGSWRSVPCGWIRVRWPSTSPAFSQVGDVGWSWP